MTGFEDRAGSRPGAVREPSAPPSSTLFDVGTRAAGREGTALMCARSGTALARKTSPSRVDLNPTSFRIRELCVSFPGIWKRWDGSCFFQWEILLKIAWVLFFFFFN